MSNLNIFSPIIDSRATRSADARIVHGAVTITFKSGTVKIDADISTYGRESNRVIFIGIENIIHKYVFEPINSMTLTKISNEILPLTSAVRMF